jgi:hypothetical protein
VDEAPITYWLVVNKLGFGNQIIFISEGTTSLYVSLEELCVIFAGFLIKLSAGKY